MSRKAIAHIHRRVRAIAVLSILTVIALSTEAGLRWT